jgi:hypothetical protein
LGLCCARAERPKLDLPHRWVYASTCHIIDQSVEQTIAISKRAAKAGYTGILLNDWKFMQWNTMPPKYFENVHKVRKTCRDLGLECVACVCPIGYSDSLLSRDPNLAEGLPVINAPFVVKDGKLVPDSDSVAIVNGGFEEYRRNAPTGWKFADKPGSISFIDTEVKFEGKASLRMQNISMHDPRYGNARVCQTLQVRPFHYYHVSAAVKTQGFEANQKIWILALGSNKVSLNWYEPDVGKSQDWKRIDVTFNSLEFSSVDLYLGVWGGKGGKIWWDDVRIEPGGLVNVVRRDGAPLHVTSEDGKIVYTEGKDFSDARDPLLGMTPWPGGFTAWHNPPVVAVPPGSRLKNGQKVLLSYYHTVLIHRGQVMCCMSEPKVYDLIKWQVEQVHKEVAPDGYMMVHDEIRVQGWDESCARRKMAPAEILADSVKRCADIIRAEDPGKPIYLWSDMFNPYQNAKSTGRYYLVKGDGPWYGSWKGLPQDVIIVNWDESGEGRLGSLRHFAGLGHKQILAGYYDTTPKSIADWLWDAGRVQGVIGVMYTTWYNNFNDLESFAAEVNKFR